MGQKGPKLPWLLAAKSTTEQRASLCHLRLMQRSKGRPHPITSARARAERLRSFRLMTRLVSALNP
jgi:hypothetical protein